MTKLVASVDANIIGHLYRSGKQKILSSLFSEVYIDDFVVGEVRRRCGDIFHLFDEDLKEQNSIFSSISSQELIERSLKSLYDGFIQDLEYLFLPRDEGEKRAIALAQSLGIILILTDDEKSDGPYHSVNKELIPGVEGALAYWDIIFLNVLKKEINYEEAKEIFYIIADQGYQPSYRGTFKSKILQSYRTHNSLKWFQEWKTENNINNQDISAFLQEIKRQGWE